MKYISYLPTLVIMLLPYTLSMESEIQVVLKHCDNSFNKKYISKLMTPRKPVNRTSSLVSVDLYFKPGIVLHSPLYIRIETFKKFATQYKSSMVNYQIELCEALEYKSHPLYKFFYHKTNETESNYLESCPLKGHKYIKPYYTSYEHMPPLLPTGTWRVAITVTRSSDEAVFAFFNYYEITSKGLAEF